MGLIIEFHVSHDDLVLSPTVRSCDEAVLQWENEITTSNGTYLYFSVFGEPPGDFDSILSRDQTVDEVTAMIPFNNRTIYRARVETDNPRFQTKIAELGGYSINITSDRDGWLVRSYFPERDRLIDIRSYCVEHDISFRVDRLYDSNAIDYMDNALLTNQHKDLLLTALYLGYYDIPRQASQRDLAEEFGVSTSAISQRIRRAIAQLIVDSLNPEFDVRSRD